MLTEQHLRNMETGCSHEVQLLVDEVRRLSVASGGIDYRALLVKYMRYVLYCEGISFLDHRGTGPAREAEAFISDEEWAALEIIEGEAES